jgi:hypothetical protein
MKHLILSIIVSILISACSNKADETFIHGRQAFLEGKYSKAREWFAKIDSTHQRIDSAKWYLRKIDSIMLINQEVATQPERSTEESTTGDDNTIPESLFVNLELDPSQYQLIDKTCAIYFKSPKERREEQDQNIAAMQKQDSIYAAENPQDSAFANELNAGIDDEVWYSYAYSSQFVALTEINIPLVRNESKPYLRFIGQNKRVMTVALSNFCDGNGECIIIFRLDKKPAAVWPNDEKASQIRQYFQNAASN